MRISDLPEAYQVQVRNKLEMPSDHAAHAPHREIPPSKADLAAEKELQNLCELELNRQGIVYLHLSPKAREKKGWPDLVFAFAGRPIAVELKSENGELSDEQVEILEKMKTNGWEVYVLRSFDALHSLLSGGDWDEWSPTLPSGQQQTERQHED